jgi:late competence protein required for DNA uptake (superfamily II DNA/RNA helicase)
MNRSGKDVISEVKEKVSDLIYSWSKSGKDRLDVVTLPQTGANIFINTISGAVEEGKSVLYITDEKDNIKLIDNIKRNSDFRGYTYLRNYPKAAPTELTVCSTATAKEMEDAFDLVIYDEINSMPQYSDDEIIELIHMRTRADGKGVIYSVNNKFHNGEAILLPIGDRKVPMIEPREIITRIDINNDIPFIVYDYIKWSINSNRNVLIYVPDEEKAEMVYIYISRYCSDKCSSSSCFISGKTDAKVMENFFKKKKSIMVTDEIGIPVGAIADTDIMVFFAGDKRFSGKILTHLASRVVKLERHDLGEVIFLCNESSGNVEEAKNITRRFNREAWEMGLLRT